MFQHDVWGVFGGNSRKMFSTSACRDKFHKRRLITHAHTPHTFHNCRSSTFCQHLLDCLMHLGAALCHAARAQSNADFAALLDCYLRQSSLFHIGMLFLL